jgi:hypothetical protein
MRTSSDWLQGAGRITGLLAGYLIALVVLQMARVPALERRVGSDRVARWHACCTTPTCSRRRSAPRR